ncbi:hypothetical protein [Acaryochloris marina]|nr:hypothetical protein [Acaryochloris marina]BDM82718.1 hypothetical protein AM10699_55790 [Acaryochloris marina MBIC10699]
MCVGCYAMPIMTLISPGPEAPPATAVPLIDSPEAKVMQVQPQVSATQVRADIAAMIARLPDSADSAILREEFTAIYQRLEGVTNVDEANTIVGEGMLNIADRLGSNPNADRVIKILHEVQEPEPQKQATHPLLKQSAWGWIS